MTRMTVSRPCLISRLRVFPSIIAPPYGKAAIVSAPDQVIEPKALGIDVPWFLQQRADEVIE
jgi:hypothetical protein